MKPLSVYVHIPFCVRKCFYCDFLSGVAEEGEKRAYVDALLEEIERESKSYVNHEVVTVFIGGGTPSTLVEGEIERVLCKLKERFCFADVKDQQREVEVTIEVNPGTVSFEKLRRYRQAGVNRLSIGLQSADDGELGRLGRIHSWSDFLVTYEDARRAGFENINVDVMGALPGQSVESYRGTLEKVIALEPEHISAYSLIIEEGTPFFEEFGKGRDGVAALPTEEEEREMDQFTGELLGENDYMRYEISNYAKEGYECRHNQVYWQRGDYVGFGLGAASLVDNVRWSNTGDRQKYIGGDTSIKENRQVLTLQEQMEEFMFLGLRLTKGVSETEFCRCFGQRMEEVYGAVLQRLKQDKLIEKGEYIRLTPYGRDISNYVMAQFLF